MPGFKRSTILLYSALLIAFTTFSYIVSPRSLLAFTDFARTLVSQPSCISNSCTTMASPSTTSSWSSPLSGFLQRAEPYRRPSSQFQPPRSSLKLAVLRNAPTEQEGFTLAVFSSEHSSDDGDSRHFAVDKQGAIHVLQPTDVETIEQLISSVETLPSTGSFRNTWVLKQERTSQAIDRILVPKSTLPPSPEENYEQEYSETSVQGFDYKKRELREPVEGFETLPQALWELAGAALEGREGDERRGDDGGVVLSYVRNLLGNVY